MTTPPTIEHAKARAKVTLISRGWCGVVFMVDKRRGLGKILLASGKVLRVPLDDLDVQQEASSRGEVPTCT